MMWWWVCNNKLQELNNYATPISLDRGRGVNVKEGMISFEIFRRGRGICGDMWHTLYGIIVAPPESNLWFLAIMILSLQPSPSICKALLGLHFSFCKTILNIFCVLFLILIINKLFIRRNWGLQKKLS